MKEVASPEEFAAELREIDDWNRAHGYDPATRAAFEALELAEMLH